MVTGHGNYVSHRHLSTLPLCIKYIDIVLGATEGWSFGTKLDLVRSGLSKLVQSGNGPPTSTQSGSCPSVQSGSSPPAIVQLIQRDLIAHNTMLFSRLDNDSLVSGEVGFGRGDGRVIGIITPGRDSV